MFKFLNILMFRLSSKLHRWLINHSKNHRPSSDPYLSGDSFRALADHVYESGHGFSPTTVKAKDVIFVEAGRLDQYFQTVHPEINFPYILISHNGDRNIGEKEAEYLDDKIIHWFAQNNTFAHPKITPLPIGLENLHHYRNGITSIFAKFKNNQPKISKISYAFNTATNPETREPALATLENLPIAAKIEGWPTPETYLGQIASYQFLASPAGNGLDCHRTWEALYLGIIPIVIDSAATASFRSLGLPIWIIDNWTELNLFTERSLNDQFEKMKKNCHTEALQLDFWVKLIEDKKR